MNPPVKLLVLDVDGVLTDGRLWYGPSGEELKGFHVRDGLGIKSVLASLNIRNWAEHTRF